MRSSDFQGIYLRKERCEAHMNATVPIHRPPALMLCFLQPQERIGIARDVWFLPIKITYLLTYVSAFFCIGTSLELTNFFVVRLLLSDFWSLVPCCAINSHQALFRKATGQTVIGKLNVDEVLHIKAPG